MRRLGFLLTVVAALVTLASMPGSPGAGAARAERAPAATIDPALAERLKSAGPDELIEVIVVLRDQAALPMLPNAHRAARLRAVLDALHAKARLAQQGILGSIASNLRDGSVTKVESLWIFDGLVLSAKPAVIVRLAARPDVQEIRLSESIAGPASTAATAATAAAESNVARVNAPAVWDLGDLGQGVVVANMDSGVDATHPDLAGSWRGGSNSWYDPNGQHPTTPTDISGHGTWTMGVMVGGSAGGTGVGVAPGAKWIAVKIFNDRGSATIANIHRGYQWLLDPDGNPSTADAPNVVNNSWGLTSGGCSLEFQLDLRSLRNAGILPVFSGGNNSYTTGGFSPANNPEAFAVGATDANDARASFSSRGPSACDGSTYPDVVAPGVNVRTTDLYGSYAPESGTSLAAPHVAGALALLLSAFPNLPVERQESALRSGAVDLGVPGADNLYGSGRLNALASYQWLATQPDFTLAASPTSATTQPGGPVAYTLSVSALNGFAGDVALSLAGLSPSQASWTLTPATVTGGSGSAQLAITTASSLSPGTYPLTLTGSSGSTSHSISLSLVVQSPPDFTLAASPTSATTQPGGPVAYTLSVGPLNGFAGDVALSLAGLSPSQASWTLTPATVTGGSGSAQLAITTASSLAPGTYPLTLTGSSGSTSHSISLSLVVQGASPDFSVVVSPASATVTAGLTSAYTVTVSASNGFAGSVSLSVSGLPLYSSKTFSRNPVAGSGTSTLTVRTYPWTARGTYPLRIVGTSGSLVREAKATLVVR